MFSLGILWSNLSCMTSSHTVVSPRLDSYIITSILRKNKGVCIHFISLPLWIVQLPTHSSEVQSVPNILKQQNRAASSLNYLLAEQHCTYIFLYLATRKMKTCSSITTPFHFDLSSFHYRHQLSWNPLFSVPKFFNYTEQEALASKVSQNTCTKTWTIF